MDLTVYIFCLLLFIINYYRLIQIQATFGFKVCLCGAALQLSSSVPINKKTIKYSITRAKKCKTESPRKWVGLDQSWPVSQQILTTSLPKALTTLAFQTSRTSFQVTVQWELGSMKLNTPNLNIQQHIMVWTKENLVPSSFFVEPLRSKDHLTTDRTKQIQVLIFTTAHKLPSLQQTSQLQAHPICWKCITVPFDLHRLLSDFICFVVNVLWLNRLNSDSVCGFNLTSVQISWVDYYTDSFLTFICFDWFLGHYWDI